MAQVTLYCKEAPELKLGPGDSGSAIDHIPGKVIVFREGFATFEYDDFPDWASWAFAPGTPFIRVVDDQETSESDPEGIVCPVDDCGRVLKSEFGLKSHLKTHQPKAEKPETGKKAEK